MKSLPLPKNDSKSSKNLKGFKTLKSQLLPLTSKEQSVLIFIQNELLTKGVSPSYQEICDHFGLASFNSVQNYLKQLSQKGYVKINQNQKRAIQILHSVNDFQNQLVSKIKDSNDSLKLKLNSNQEPSNKLFSDQSSYDQGSSSKVLAIPFLGRVAAGQPIERFAENEFLDVPAHFIKTPGHYFALKVEGDSMIDEGIFDGDFLVVLSQKNVKNGDLVVASIESESTVKRFYHNAKGLNQPSPTNNLIELRPANPRLTSMYYPPESVEIKGLVKALLRSF